jgi:S1-C subfamily serine protease
MNAVWKIAAFVLGVLLVTGFQENRNELPNRGKSFAPTSAQDSTKDWRPFVKLGARLRTRIYKDPLVRNGRVVDEGILIKDVKSEESVGSGTVITPGGLILTNFHVANLALVGESAATKDENGQLFFSKTTPLNNGIMLVYELDSRDYRKEPTLKYQARFLAGDPELDVAVLKIHASADGSPIARSDFPNIPLGNPYDIPVNAPLNVIGYPEVVGASVNPTEALFSTYTKGARNARDGALVTVSTISGGNSGGTVLYKGRQVAIPTQGLREEDPRRPTAAFSALHPVTWAVRSFAITSIRDRLQGPEIDPRWLESEHNSDITRTHVFLGGKILSAASSKPVGGAQVVYYRADRSFSEIIELDRELVRTENARLVQRLASNGMKPEEVVATVPLLRDLKLTIEEVQELMKVKLGEADLSADLKRYEKGEFFFAAYRTSAEPQSDGFFLVAVPRKQNLKVIVSANGYRDLSLDEGPRAGLFADVGEIKLYPPMSLPAAPPIWDPSRRPGRSPLVPSL